MGIIIVYKLTNITGGPHPAPLFPPGRSADFAAPFARTGLRYTAERCPDVRAPFGWGSPGGDL